VPKWPDRLTDDQCLILTDDPSARHPDSRQLGPVPVDQLLWRVVVPLRIPL
jgi:hypothetical protein